MSGGLRSQGSFQNEEGICLLSYWSDNKVYSPKVDGPFDTQWKRSTPFSRWDCGKILEEVEKKADIRVLYRFLLPHFSHDFVEVQGLEPNKREGRVSYTGITFQQWSLPEPHNDGGRDWSCAAASQGKPTIASVPPNSRNRQGWSPLKILGRAWPCQHLDFGLLFSSACMLSCFSCVWLFATPWL